MYEVNIFANYSQEENHFTNGLLSLLALSTVDGPEFLNSFLNDVLHIVAPDGINTFKVLREMDGSTADAELSGSEFCLHFETKIESGKLRGEQVQSHLERLKKHSGVQRLFLLTPDDSTSQYVDHFVSLDREHIQHREWKSVFSFLERSLVMPKETVFLRLVRQFLERIRHRIFEQDIAGVIFKVAFDEVAGVDNGKYLTEMQSGAWTEWNTPRECKLLDGKGRKLILYDRRRKSLTVEVEIKSVQRTNKEDGFPWTNEFAPGTLQILETPIPLSELQGLGGFENFGKERSPYRKLTQEQYRQLMSNQKTNTNKPVHDCLQMIVQPLRNVLIRR
jgi:hypothetical protein